MGHVIDITLFSNVNDPQHFDLDVACFIMFIFDLLNLFDSITCSENRRMSDMDLVEFNDKLHVISEAIVVRVYIGRNIIERDRSRIVIVNKLYFLRIRIYRILFFGMKWQLVEGEHTLDRFKK